MELHEELRYHIANLTQIFHDQETTLRDQAASDPAVDEALICKTVACYWLLCERREIHISAPALIQEKTRFWFSIARLALAWCLRVLGVAPRFRHQLVAKSVVALVVLSPRLMDVM